MPLHGLVYASLRMHFLDSYQVGWRSVWRSPVL